MRIVITGGSGFIGSHLCDRFLDEGHEVVCLDSFVTGAARNTEHLEGNAAFTRIECDVSAGLPVEGPVDRVLHFASPANPTGYYKIPITTLRAGSLATFHCADLALRTGARLMLASTSEVYGDPLEHPQRESYWGNVNPIGVRSCYDEAKRFSEAVVMAYAREHGLETRIVRIFNTYGPRMRTDDGRALPNFCTQALRGDPITLFGDGSQTRSFCYISDLIDGIERLLESDYGEPVNLGNPEEVTMAEVVAEILELSGSASPIVHEPLPPDDPQRRQPDIAVAIRELGWQPRVPRREGLQKTLAYFQAELAKV